MPSYCWSRAKLGVKASEAGRSPDHDRRTKARAHVDDIVETGNKMFVHKKKQISAAIEPDVQRCTTQPHTCKTPVADAQVRGRSAAGL